MLTKITKLRKVLHQNPELSGFEVQTAERLINFIKSHCDAQIISGIGGNGFVAVFNFHEKGPTIGFRCELDALPIHEENTFNHRSKVDGVSHKCGHDGHMAIVTGLLFWIKEKTFKSGKIVLIFQPAEETGKGAFKMLNDSRFKQLKLDYIFALHNIPGEPLHSILITEPGFSAEVQSLSITIKGKKSHAAEPENGLNPALGISHIIQELTKLNHTNSESKNFAIVTPIHIVMGEKAYGISPEHAELYYTIRTWDGQMMTQIKEALLTIIKTLCESYKLKFTIDWFEYFPATHNDHECNEYIKKAVDLLNLKVQHRPQPFRFGEDFGWFSSAYKTAMFGIGSGIDSPALHHANYDFPDAIIKTGIAMYTSLIENLLKPNKKVL